MKKIALLITVFLCGFVMAGFVSAEEYNIVPPSSGAPDWMVLLSGKWASEWVVRANTKITPRPATLIFESISPDGTTANLFYLCERWKPDRREAKISGDKREVKIEFATLTFKLKGGVLTSEQTFNTAQGNYTWNIVMKKVP